MATNSWNPKGAGSAFGTEGSLDSDWSLGHVPTSSEDAVIGANFTITSDTAEDVNSISLGSNSVLLITGGIFTAENGTGPNVNNGGIQVAGGAIIEINGGTFNNSSTGVIELKGSGASSQAALLLGLNGTITLAGSGTIEMNIGGPVSSNLIVENPLAALFGPATLVNQSETISGTGSIGGGINFTNGTDGKIDTNNGTSTSGGILNIVGSAGGGSFTNNGTVEADNGGTLIFGVDGQTGIVNNSTTVLNGIGLNGSTATTSLEIAGNVTVTSSSGGFITLGGSNANFDQIVSDGNAATLTLVDQTLKGAGVVGDANLTLTNQSGSTIDADNSHMVLSLATGSHTITNGGAIEADGGGLFIFSPVNNTGTMSAIDGGTLVVIGAVTGSGAVDIGQNSTLTTESTISGNVTFTGTQAELVIFNSLANGGIGGNVVGAITSDVIAFPDIPYSSSVTAVWQQNSSSAGTLSLESGGSTLATLNLAGYYASADFAPQDVAAGEFSGSTQVVLTTPPTIAGTVANQAVIEETIINPFTHVTIADPNAGQTESVTVTPSHTANGTLSDPNAASDGSTITHGVYSVSGTAAAVTADLDALVFTPAALVAPGTIVTTGFTIAVTDTAGLHASDSTTSVVEYSPILPLTFTNGESLTTPEQQAELLYVAYFARAADVNGANYWANELMKVGTPSGGTIGDEAVSFSQQVESMNLYPLLASPTTATTADITNFINSVYEDLFDRPADAKGLAYWSGVNGFGGFKAALNAGTITQLQFQSDVGGFILEVATGAQNDANGQDITTMQNKVAAASYFTDQLAIQNVPYANNQPAEVDTQAHTVVSSTNSTAASVTTAESVALMGITNDPHAG